MAEGVSFQGLGIRQFRQKLRYFRHSPIIFVVFLSFVYGALFNLPEGLSSGKREPHTSFNKYLFLKVGIALRLSGSISALS